MYLKFLKCLMSIYPGIITNNKSRGQLNNDSREFISFFTFYYSLQGQQPQDSPKKSADKGPAPNPPLTGEAQLKYENDRLKLALAQRY